MGWVKIFSLIVSTLVSLSASTLHLYAIYSPELITRTGLSATKASYLPVAANLGSSVGGLIAGLLIDSFGPQIGTIMGAICESLGFYVLYLCYRYRWDTFWTLIASMVGIGFANSLGYFSAIKATTVNFADNKGVANAFPISAYGLAPLVYAAISSTFYAYNMAGFLEFVAIFSGVIMGLGSFFVRIFEPSEKPLHHYSGMVDSKDKNQNEAFKYLLKGHRGSLAEVNLVRSNSTTSLFSMVSDAPSLSDDLHSSYSSIQNDIPSSPRRNISSSSLARKPSAYFGSSSRPLIETAKISDEAAVVGDEIHDNSTSDLTRHNVQPVTNSNSAFAHVKYLMGNRLFIAHWLLSAFYACTGQVYIYFVGFIVRALIDGQMNEMASSKTSAQALQVSLISGANFLGRLLSGVISDYFDKKLGIDRLYVVIVALVVASFAGLSLIYIDSINYLGPTSFLIGLAFGFVYGCLPTVMAELFGSRNFATTWSLMGCGPILLFLAMSKYFGYYYDAHSQWIDDGSGTKIRMCLQGCLCYRGIFILTTTVSFTLLPCYLGLIRYCSHK